MDKDISPTAIIALGNPTAEPLRRVYDGAARKVTPLRFSKNRMSRIADTAERSQMRSNFHDLRGLSEGFPTDDTNEHLRFQG